MRGVFILLLLIVTLSTLQASQDVATGSIEGVVVSGTTNLPIEEASVTLEPTDRSFYPFRTGIEPVITAASGKFAFTGLKAGAYHLEILSNGYVRMSYGQKTFRREAELIQLTAGEAIRGLVVRMTPTGSVSGRIRDSETRREVAGVPIQLMRVGYDFSGERYFERQGFARTNDRGEYRLYFVTPGRYYVYAGGIRPREPGVSGRATPNEIPETYSPVYYPGVTKMEDATVITVKPGADVVGIDIPVGEPQNLYRIRGRVVDSSTGSPPSSAQVGVYSRSNGRWELVPDVFQRYRSDGTFDIPPIAPGSYLVSVDASSDGYARKVTPVEIVSADMDSLIISVSSGVSVSGKITFEGRRPPQKQLEELLISLTSPDQTLGTRAKVVSPGTNAEAALLFEHVTPGDYRLRLNLPNGFYVKDARFGGFDILQNSFQISDRETNGLQMVISSGVGSLEGTVTNMQFETLTRAIVALVPNEGRSRLDRFQSTTTDRDGRFSFSSIPPGDYRIVAWEALEPYAYFDPEVMRQGESKGKRVQFSESSRQTVDLIAIPFNN